ncbi:MAG TPA: hypothetical protein VJ140_20255 [Actinomycetota bacterium]|nr:hypothetical protein [Actinomycetota bacterium]
MAAALQHSRTGIDLYSATDDGPRPAKRMRNLARDPRATVLADAQERAHARQLLWDRYPQFGDVPPAEAASPPMMAVDIEQWAGWAYSD